MLHQKKLNYLVIKPILTAIENVVIYSKTLKYTLVCIIHINIYTTSFLFYSGFIHYSNNNSKTCIFHEVLYCTDESGIIHNFVNDTNIFDATY